MKKILLTSAVALAVFSACSKMDYEGNDHEGTKVNVKADIKGMNTRLTDGTTWDSGDAIGVSGGTSNINIKRSYSSDGETSWTGSNNIYVLGSAETTFNAYYPFTGEEGTAPGTINFSVVDENNEYVGDDKVDYLWATATASKSNTTAEFEFEHKMSKIALTFSDGTDTRADETASTTNETAQEVKYTLSNVITDGTFNTATGEVTAGSTKGTIVVTTAMGETSSVIVPSISSSSTTTDDNAITLTIETGGKAYQGTITPGLSESNQYNYTVTISSTTETNAITVSSSSVKGWTSNDAKAVELTEIEVENTLEVGDFLLADGTVIDKDADLTGKSVKGVVFYVGNPQPSVLYNGTDGYTTANDLLATDYSTCTNGLAISLTEVSAQAFAAEATEDYCLHLWFNETSPTGIYPAGYTVKSDNSGYDGCDAGRNSIQGYNNTSLWKSFATAKSLTINALTQLATFQSDNAVTNASTWYIPSSAEFTALSAGVTSSDDATQTVYGINTAVSASITKANGTDITGTYWSSTDGRYTDSSAQVMAVNMKIGSTYNASKAVGGSPTALTKTYKFRYAIAF